MRPILAIGTVCWFVACCVLLLTGHHGVWMWSCVAGWVLGLIGFLIVWWQRSASRRGSRSAQRGL